MPYHSVSNQRWDGSRGPQPANLTLPTRLKPSVKDFMFLCQVMCWPPEGLFQLLLGSANKARRGRRSSDMRNTCPSHRSLWWCSCSMMDMFLGPKNPSPDLCVANPMFPPNPTDTPKTTVIEHRQSPYIFCLQWPCLWTIQQDWEHCHWVHPTLRG